MEARTLTERMDAIMRSPLYVQLRSEVGTPGGMTQEELRDWLLEESSKPINDPQGGQGKRLR